MNPQRVAEILEELRALPMFPNEPSVMAALMRLCGNMCSDEAQVRWLVNRMTSGIYAQWPGPAEMRACFCCRYRPKDGVSAYSTVYPDGLPPDPTAPPRAGIMAPERKELPSGHVASADAQLDRRIRMLADVKDMNRSRNPVAQKSESVSPERRAEIQSQIDAIERQNRETRARKELGIE